MDPEIEHTLKKSKQIPVWQMLQNYLDQNYLNGLNYSQMVQGWLVQGVQVQQYILYSSESDKYQEKSVR